MREEWWERPTCWVCDYGWILLLLLLLALLLFFTHGLWGPVVGLFRQADLALSSTVDDAEVVVDDPVNITVNLANLGPRAARDVLVSNPVPPGLDFENVQTSQGVYDLAAGSWSLGELPVGETATMTIQAVALEDGRHTNIATTAAAVSEEDPVLLNNRTQTTVEAHSEADLALRAELDLESIIVGNQVSFTVTLTNNGPHNATEIRLAGREPRGLTFDVVTPSQGSFDPEEGVWEVGALASGTSADLMILATANQEGRITSRVAILTEDQVDPEANNNELLLSLIAEPELGTGDVQITLEWSNRNDLDLHVIDPYGEEIFYSNDRSESGGELDIDSNAGCGRNSTISPVENIYWPDGQAPLGAYQVFVKYFTQCTSPRETPFTVRLLVDGREEFSSGEVTSKGQQIPVFEFSR